MCPLSRFEGKPLSGSGSANMPTICRCIARARSWHAQVSIHWLAGHVYMPEKLHRAVLADWVGKAAFHLKPVVDRLAKHLKQSGKLFMPSRQIAAQSPAG
jgi:hypothetical protein